MAGENDFQMQPVTSSQIAEIGYSAETKQLRVRFIHKNSLYEYEGAPQAIYDSLLVAPSVGSEFGQTVKGVFPYRKLE